jgi:DNA-directed RNA polymerase specialized sigma24 family protein
MVMGAMKKIQKLDFREKMTQSILDTLAHLPEAHKQIFVWKHYYGLAVENIAKNLNCAHSDVEGILRQIDSTLTRRANTLRI